MKSKRYRLFDEETHKIVVRRDVVFNEMDFDRKHEEKVTTQRLQWMKFNLRPSKQTQRNSKTFRHYG